jgi:hypothetical protein
LLVVALAPFKESAQIQKYDSDMRRSTWLHLLLPGDHGARPLEFALTIEPMEPTDTSATTPLIRCSRIARVDVDGLRWHLDEPSGDSVGVSVAGIFLRISGWVFSESDPVHYIVIHSEFLFRSPLLVLPLHPRVDVATAFGLDRLKPTGFTGSVNLLGCSDVECLHISCVCASGAAQFQVDAGFYSQCYIRLAQVHFEVTLPQLSYQPGRSPIFVSSLGRSGSTALMKAFSFSDEIAVAGSHPLENRTMSYFIHMTRLLVTPSSHYLPTATSAFLDIPFVGATNPFIEPLDWPGMNILISKKALDLISYPLIHLLEEHAACIEAATGKGKVSYLAEKLVPNTIIPGIAKSIWPRSIEILLIREFDDWLRSALAFSERSGQYFGSGVAERDLIERILREVQPFLIYVASRTNEFVCIRYEDLVRDSERVTRSLCHKLGIKFVEKMVDGVKQAEPLHVTAGEYASTHDRIANTASIRELRNRYNRVLGYE